jgi:lipopolysaccharide export system permease protein
MILVRYVLKEHLAPFLAALFVITFLFVVDFLVHLMDSIFSKGLPFQVVMEMFVLNLAWMLALSIPMAVLVATLMAFGRMSADNEITIIKAAGISPTTLIRPVLLVSTLLMVLMIVFNNWILPEANHRSAALRSAISRKKPHAFLTEGRLITQFPDVQIWIDHIDQGSGILHGIQIFQLEERNNPRIILADSGRIEPNAAPGQLRLHLFDGENHLPDREDPEKYFRIRFLNQKLAIQDVDASLKRKERKHRSDREMPIEDMLEMTWKARERQDKLVNDNAKALWNSMGMITQLVLGDTTIPVLNTASNTAQNEKKEMTVSEKLEQRRAIRVVLQQERAQIKKLERTLERITREEKRIAQYWVEIHKKFSIPVACLVFVLVGAPLGVMARKGGLGTGIVYSLIFFVIYWAGLMGGETLADKLYITPSIAMWTPNILIALSGLFLLWRMSRDKYSGVPWWVRIWHSIQEWRKERKERKKALQKTAEETP